MDRVRREEKRGNKVGLYTTVIVHLVVLLILLSLTFSNKISKGSVFMIDFSKQRPTREEVKEPDGLQDKGDFKKDISRELDKMIAATPAERVRNVARDVNGNLKDDRHTDTKQLYRDAKDLQRRLDASKRDAMRQDEKIAEYNSESSAKKRNVKEEGYSGPSVLSYSLKGRKGEYLEIPAYKWYGAGDVTVHISVDRTGHVVSAKAVPEKSSKDKNLYALAVEAALNSAFTPLSSAPNPQEGNIVYRFISQ
ncbi:MAG: energy transducer TonB [Bacteroidales bacterium]|jgi:hypothetical protein|nr:energy transducer TonB [Bacteroidales bacterium]MCI2121308.1 energy transducer TonB [Bacteroidales bacterium]MCI2145202.1 energy transducer TonB [Bacteroidales bacterium]